MHDERKRCRQFYVVEVHGFPTNNCPCSAGRHAPRTARAVLRVAAGE
jgi:hypothetical protein